LCDDSDEYRYFVKIRETDKVINLDVNKKEDEEKIDEPKN